MKRAPALEIWKEAPAAPLQKKSAGTEAVLLVFVLSATGIALAAIVGPIIYEWARARFAGLI